MKFDHELFENTLNKAIEIIDSEKTINGILKELYHKILITIFSELEEELHIRNGQIYIDLYLWVMLHHKIVIKNYPSLVIEIIKILKVNSLIDKRSKEFKDVTSIEVNPLPDYIVYYNAIKFDKILDARDALISQSTEEVDIKLYIYLKLFHIGKIDNDFFSYLEKENCFETTNGLMLCILQLPLKDDYVPLPTTIVDVTAAKMINSIDTQKIFSKDMKIYESRMRKFQYEHQIKIKTAKRAVKFEHTMQLTPLHTYIIAQTNYPKSSLLEIDKFFPNFISQELLDIEKQNYNLYRTQNQSDDLDSDNSIKEPTEKVEQKKMLQKNVIYQGLNDIKKVPKNKKALTGYLQYWYSFLNMHKQDNPELEPIFTFLEYQLNQADQTYRSNAIAASTLSKYLQILFDYCFDFIILHDSIDKAIPIIMENFKSSHHQSSNAQNKVREFLLTEHDMELEKYVSTNHYGRSIVSSDLLNKLIQRFRYIDKRDFNHPIEHLRRIAYCVIANYSGLRRNELSSRLVTDIYEVKNNSFVIDVNKKGIKQINKHLLENDKNLISLKNDNAKRRVEFKITNTKHYNIVKKYYELISSYHSPYLFPTIVKSKVRTKQMVMDLQLLDDINKIFKDISDTYLVIHSFRHTYATMQLLELLQKKKKSISDIFDLSTKIGHENFDTTLSNYIHWDIVQLLI